MDECLCKTNSPKGQVNTLCVMMMIVAYIHNYIDNNGSNDDNHTSNGCHHCCHCYQCNCVCMHGSESSGGAASSLKTTCYSLTFFQEHIVSVAGGFTALA